MNDSLFIKWGGSSEVGGDRKQAALGEGLVRSTLRLGLRG
jgi:hypothetical protein